MLLTTIWIGLAGALLMFAGDMLLYYTPEDFACDPKSSAKEKINAIIDVMKGLPAGRVMAGGMIGPVAAFLYCVGFYHIVLMANETSHTLAMTAFLLSCFGIITGGAYHSHCAYLGLLGDDQYRNALNTATMDVRFKSWSSVPAEARRWQTAEGHSHHRFRRMDESDFRDLLRGRADRNIGLSGRFTA